MVKLKDKGLMASARETSRRNLHKVIGGGSLALSFLLPVAGHAQATTGGGSASALGVDGAPSAQNYLDAAHGFQGTLAPVLTILLTFLFTTWAIYKAAPFARNLISGFVKPR